MKQLILLLAFGIFTVHISQAQSITISEINYRSANNPDPGDWIELHNFGGTPINIGGYTIIDSTVGSFAYTIPANTTLASGAYLVIAKDQTQFNAIHPSVSNVIGNFTFSLGKTGEIITLKNATANTVAIAEYLTTNVWPKGANGEGRTIELINQSTNGGLNNPTAWRDGCMLGSPGAAPTPCNDPILISEINYNSDTLLNMGEYVELLNNSSTAINLTGWYLQDGKDTVTNKFYFLQNTILNPGAYILVSNDTASLHKYHGVLPNEKGNFTFNLSNGGEIIRLFNPFDVLKFSVHYNDSIPFTDSADGKGYTLELKSKTGYMNEGSNWFAGCRGGSPGVAYTPNCKPIYALGLTQLNTDKDFMYYTAPSGLYVQNEKQQYFEANVYTLSGQLIAHQKASKNNDVKINLPSYNGILILECKTKHSISKYKILYNQ
jgi:hypothetical protein